jgi:hypothetical protein
MGTLIAQRYVEELGEWHRSIEHYEQEMEEISGKLSAIIQRNSIVDIAEKTEAHQDLLNAVSADFLALEVLMKQQEDALMQDDHYVDDSKVPAQTDHSQGQIRHRMQEAERKFVDAKYQCLEFISDMLR